jgi:hypothetical protein
MLRTCLLLFTIGLIALAIAAYVLTPPPAHVAAAIDTSRSEIRDCGGLRKSAEALAGIGDIREGSTLTLLAMPGGNGIEPLRLFDKPIPIASDKVMGRDDAGFARERTAFFDAFEKACLNAPDSKTSPILPLVRRSIEHLRSRGCGPKRTCYLTVQTDLEDDSPELGPVIARAAKKSAVEPPSALVGSIDNTGIHVEFSGTAETRLGRKTRRPRPETLELIWRRLFTHPESVRFQPFWGQ